MESPFSTIANRSTAPHQLREAWGDPVDMSEFWRDTPDFYPTAAGLPYTTIDDRLDGKYLPYYRTEQDLAVIRANSRNLAAIDGVAIGASEALKNYVLGNGMLFKAQARNKNEPPQGLVEYTQSLIDTILDKWCFYGSLDRELMDRTIEDGEAGVCLEWLDNQPRVSVVEPDQITEPRSPQDLYDWLDSSCGIDCMSFDPSWSFGVLTSRRHTDHPMGYHVVYDTGGNDWEFYPVHQFEHFKSSRTRRAKRGVSQYYQVLPDMRAEAKLSTNMALGAALQAAIAWIEEHPPGTTQGSVQAVNAAKADVRSARPTLNNGTRTVNQRQHRPGTILSPSPGRTYKAGPMGAERNAGFQLVAQYILRRIGIRWNFPEYMISGDASNANYSSTLVAGSPFVKAREAEQVFYGAGYRSLIIKALRMCHEHGYFDKFGLEWAAILQLVDIVADPTKVETRDPLQLAQTQQIQKAMGILSDRTAATQAGLDYDQEVKSGAKAEAPASPFGGLPTPTRESRIAAAASLLWEGYP